MAKYVVVKGKAYKVAEKKKKKKKNKEKKHLMPQVGKALSGAGKEVGGLVSGKTKKWR